MDLSKLNIAVSDFQVEAATAWNADGGATLGAIADARRVMKRIIKRAEALSENVERVEIKLSRGPTVEFSGQLLCEDEFTTRGRDPLKITMEVWETRGGALIAVSYSEPADRDGFENAEATVVEPIEDVQAMRFAVMDHFQWEDRARSMVRKKLDWALRREVE